FPVEWRRIDLAVLIDAARDADDRGGAYDGQDFEGERHGADAVLLLKPRHEVRHVSVRQGGVVLNLSLLRRQHGVEPALPARWIVAGAILVRGGPVEHCLNAAANAPGGLGLVLPDRL